MSKGDDKRACWVQLEAGAGAKSVKQKFLLRDTIERSIRDLFDIDDDARVLLRDGEGAHLAPVAGNMTDGAEYTLVVRQRLQPAAVASAATPSAGSAAAAQSKALAGQQRAASAAAAPIVVQHAELPEYPDQQGQWSVTVLAAEAKNHSFTGWATKNEHSRSGVASEAAYRKCIGVFACPRPDCKFTLRPKVRPKDRDKQKDTKCAHHADQVNNSDSLAAAGG